ncbi:hypothetical protein [Enterococcus faecium]|uniref:hypothetical protein n=1 Tax=Enterococcus faecium TaxID=1352 RepID=UPI000AA9C6B3|nr:hypothetical protein [Enterococcus faecium]
MPFIYKNTRHSNKKVTRGGTLFSVGSDGHYLEHFRFHFDDLFALLKAKGVTELAIYQKGKRIMVPLPV